MKQQDKNSSNIESNPLIKNNHWTVGVNRRQFIKSASVLAVLTPLLACKPKIIVADLNNSSNLINQSSEVVELKEYIFTNKQHKELLSVYMQMFPDNGDGPSAKDLNILTYLEWALTDERNRKDGDADFIKQGLIWLNQYSQEKYSDDFVNLSEKKQMTLLEVTAESEQGKRWMSILSYYLIEALTLDPYYGGNTNQIGWQWLKHRGGSPSPSKGRTYRDFE